MKPAVPKFTSVALVAALLGLAVTVTGPTSGVFTGQTGDSPNVFNAGTLLAPTNLSASPNGSDMISLSWTYSASPFAAGYNVYRSQTTGGPYALIGSVGGRLNTSYLDSGLVAPPNPAWFDTAWGYRKKLTIDPANVFGDQVDFPVLVHLPVDAGLAAAQLSKDGIVFTQDNGTTQLAHQIETYNAGTGELMAWVEVPALSMAVDTDIYLYYGNNSAPNQENPAATWSNGFEAVWHLSEVPTGALGEIIDSAKTNHGTAEGAIGGYAASQPARFGTGLLFDGGDDLIRVPDSADLDGISATGTISLWINWTSAADGDFQIVMASSNRFAAAPDGPDGYEWASQLDGNHFFYPWGGDNLNYNLGLNPFINGQWHHLAVTFEWATKEAIIYVDGAPMAYTTTNVPTYWTALASPMEWLWGGNPDRPTRNFAGLFDEIRVASAVRPPSWIQTERQNQLNPAAFASPGPEEPLPNNVYYYVVDAYSGSWTSPYSNEATAATGNPPAGFANAWTTGLTHTTGTGPDRLLIFMAGMENGIEAQPTGADRDLVSVTYGGQSLIQGNEAVVCSGSPNSFCARTELWYLNEAGILAATGNTFSPVWAGGAPYELEEYYAAVTLRDIDQVTPLGESSTNFTTTANPVQVASPIAVTSNDLVVESAFAGNGGTYTPGAGYTEGTNQTVLSSTMATAYKVVAAAGSEQPDMTHSSSINRQVILAAVINGN